MQNELKKLFDLFVTEGTFSEGKAFGSGHIHETYKIITAGNGKDDYILQKLNNNVFRDIPGLQENFERVTNHIRQKLSEIPGSDIKRECLQLVYARNGKSWVNDDDGSFWRLLVFIPDHKTYDLVDSPDKAYEGGKAIGRFQAMVSDLPGKPLNETIPFFHDVEKRIETFEKLVETDRSKRKKDCGPEIDFILGRAEKMRIIHQLGREGKIPVRITHNDTKFNNILFDLNGKSLCIIDLDTVMPGYYHPDFGDAIRTGANMAAEDEADLSKVNINIDLFEAYARGYLSETRQTLNDLEKEYLAFTPILITYEQALRFLGDHIDGDRYYRIHHPEHNLQRARAQIRLVEKMEANYGEMQRIVYRLV